MKKSRYNEPPHDVGTPREVTYYQFYQQNKKYISRYETFVIINNKIKSCALGVLILSLLFVLINLADGNYFEAGWGTWLGLMGELFIGYVWYSHHGSNCDLTLGGYNNAKHEAKLLNNMYGFE